MKYVIVYDEMCFEYIVVDTETEYAIRAFVYINDAHTFIENLTSGKDD